MLGEPALVPRHHRGDAQREALLAEQRVAAVAGAVRPDLARLREVRDRGVVGVARPRHVGGARLERGADGVHAGHERAVRPERVERALDARHDAHARGRVGRVGQLHADLRRRRAERAHRERHHVHRATAHGAAEAVAQLRSQGLGLAPVVGRAGIVDARDVGAILDPRDVARVRASEEGAGAQRLVEFREGAGLHQHGGEASALGLGAIAPDDVLGRQQLLPLGDPVEQATVLGAGGGHWHRGVERRGARRERMRVSGPRAPIEEHARACGLVAEPLAALRACERGQRDQVHAREAVDHAERVPHARRERRARAPVEQQHADADERLARRAAAVRLQVGEGGDHDQHADDHPGLAEPQPERHDHREGDREIDQPCERARPQGREHEAGRGCASLMARASALAGAGRRASARSSRTAARGSRRGCSRSAAPRASSARTRPSAAGLRRRPPRAGSRRRR